MPLPLLDIAAILKNNTNDQLDITKEVTEVQNAILKIISARASTGSDPSAFDIPSIALTSVPSAPAAATLTSTRKATSSEFCLLNRSH